MKMLPSLILSATLLAGCGEQTKPAAPSPRLAFLPAHATNALAHVAAFVADCTPRDACTPGADRAAVWLHARLRAKGANAAIDRFSDATPRGTQTFANVTATIRGTGDEWILLLTHFDTMSGIGAGFQGANDGGSSTGLLLEFATAVLPSAPLKHNVLCAFLDGEECQFGYSDRDGFHGSKRLAKSLKLEGRKIKAVILMDMIGDRDLKITMPRNSTPALRVLALEAAEATGDRDKIGLFDGYVYDDHQAFFDLGYPAVNLIDFTYGSRSGENDFWHTPQDTLDKLSDDSLAVTGRIVTEMVNRLENGSGRPTRAR